MAQKLTLLQSGEILLNLVSLNLLGQQNNKKILFSVRPRRAKSVKSIFHQNSDFDFLLFAFFRGPTTGWHRLKAVWPDWAIYCTLGNFSKPMVTIILPKLPIFLAIFCKGFKIFHFSSEFILGQHLATFYWSHWLKGWNWSGWPCLFPDSVAPSSKNADFNLCRRFLPSIRNEFKGTDLSTIRPTTICPMTSSRLTTLLFYLSMFCT